ncbi:helix-turn-helix domain-containing protein [Conexibacter woesei]|uniref:helix-turn-helix domain-containing protein n=1 Tax=Conexibacter woesei TaxID=191495 RepID=UPI0018C9D291|nr:helix-turn-helix transcriptional regulator [Conexibacter woesei]
MAVEITIGYRVWSLRMGLHLSQEQLARSCEMAPAVFSRIERDEVDARTSSLERIARGLGVTMAELFDGVKWSPRSERVVMAPPHPNPRHPLSRSG